MVDLDDSYGGDGSNDSGGSSGSSDSSSKSNSPSDVPSPVKSEVDVKDRVSDTSIGDTSKQWASKYGDLGFERGKNKKLKKYIKTQEDECSEFYDNMEDMAKEVASEGAQKFTLAHHAMIMNMAHNRAGIKDVLESEFGMSEKKAIKTVDKICENAGEYDAFVGVMDKIAIDGLDVMDLEEMV